MTCEPLTQEQQKQVEDVVPYLDRLARAYAVTPQERDDFRSAAYLAACIAVRSWDAAKGAALTTWVRRYVRTAIRRDRQFSALPVSISSRESEVEQYLAANHNSDSPQELEDAAREKFPGRKTVDIETAAWFAEGARAGTGDGIRRHPNNPRVSDPSPDAEVILEANRRAQLLLDQLPLKLRATVKLHLEGLTGPEIADIEGVTREAIRQRVAKAKEIWRTGLIAQKE